MKQRIASWPAPVRHLILLLAGVLLSWAGTDLVPLLQNQSNLLGSLMAAVVIAVLAILTPLVNSYGVGATRQGPRR